MSGNQRRERIKYWSQLLLLPIYGFSFLVPRNKCIWLFGSTFGRRFADNPRYFYLYLCAHPKEEIRPVWISHNKDAVQLLHRNKCEAYYYRSLKGIWYCLCGGVYIFDNYSKDINFWLSGGAVKFNLWHGTGNKKANHDNQFDHVRHPKNLWERFKTFPRRLSDEKPSHYTLATSEPLAVISASVFHTTRNHIIVDGYPRNDAMLIAADFFQASEKAAKEGTEIPAELLRTYQILTCVMTKEETRIREKIIAWKQAGYRIDFYMPTFRNSETDFFKIMDLERFNAFLEQNQIIFVIKLHPKSKLKKEFAEVAYSNICNIDGENDPYIFLGYVDLLTADYSSVYSDFMLLDRPVVAFHYDYAQYHGQTRDEYVPFEEYMPERKAVNMEELMAATLEVLAKDCCRDKRKKSRDRMFLYQDAKSSERITEKVCRLMEK